MFAPAGRFCTSCPTVIVDERMIASGMVVSKAKYRRVAGVLNAESDKPMIFSTWRGKKNVYFLDESEQIENMLTVSEMGGPVMSGPRPPPPALREELKKKKAKRKQAQKARKQNRKSRKK